MEPVGLAVGVLGLAGLFSSCMDAVERFDSWRNFTDESRSLGTHLEAEKLRLKIWGAAVGFDNGAVSPDHHEALDDPQLASTIHEHLLIIKKLCTNVDNTVLPVPGSSVGHAKLAPVLGRIQAQQNTQSDLTRNRLKWVLRDRVKCMAQIEMLGVLVQDLHNLVPPGGTNCTLVAARAACTDALRQMGGTFSCKGPWTEFGQALARVEEDLETEAERAMYTWLLGRYIENELYDYALRKRLDGTCDWILTRHSFLAWASDDFPSGLAKILWVNGPAGFGKTVLCAKVVQHLCSTLNVPPVHFFFSSDFESSKDPFVAMRSWLAQLLSNPAAFELVREEWAAQSKQAATQEDIIRVFGKIVDAIPGFTFIVDGLDECSCMEDDWARFFEALQRAVDNSRTRIMIVSRDEPDIRCCIINITRASTYEHKISLEDVRPDTYKYCRSVVNRKLPNKDDSIKDELSRKLAGRCNGQFLWVKLQEPSLRGGKNKKQLEAAVNTSPIGLERLYDRNWERITCLPIRDQKRAFSLLRWAAFALRPLTVSQITEALLIDDKCDDVPFDEMPDNIDQEYIDSEILSLCGSLVEIHDVTPELVHGSKTVHLTHFSVKQFVLHKMTDKADVLIASASLRVSYEAVHNSILAAICLRYVNFQSVWRRHNVETRHGVLSFLNYAASSWYHHLMSSQICDHELTKLINELFDSNNPNWHSWGGWYELNSRESMEGEGADGLIVASPLYYATRLCLIETVRFLVVARRCKVDDKTTSGMTPLATSCQNGSIGITRILLDGGADSMCTNNDGWTPLNLASHNGHDKTVKLLLDSGADIQMPSNDGRTPIYSASITGHCEVLKLLLEKRVDLDSPDDQGWTALHAAALKGHIEVVQLLVNNGANLMAEGDMRLTPLHAAALKGHMEVAQLLVNNGANVMAKVDMSLTPLHLASFYGQVNTVELLVHRGANPAATAKYGWTPLHLASVNGNIEIVQLLIQGGANIATMKKGVWTPLHLASLKGHLEVVQLLVYNGANIVATAKNGWTPLHFASFHGHIKTVELLIHKEANITALSRDGWTPLHCASEEGHLEIVQLLIYKGANINAMTKDGSTALHLASENGYIEIVHLLISQGANVAAIAEGGWMPLHFASLNGNVEVVRLLINKGANAAAVAEDGSTPLHLASFNGHIEVVQLLVNERANIAAVSEGRWTPLYLASQNGHLDVVRFFVDKGALMVKSDIRLTPLHIAALNGDISLVQLLIDKGADITATIEYGSTPLHLASTEGHAEVVRLLIENGANIAAMENHEWTPLHLAAKNGRVEVVRLLIEKKADVSALGNDGWTPLHLASREGHIEVVQLLIDKGHSVADITKYGLTPLHMAAENGHIEVAQLLVDTH